MKKISLLLLFSPFFALSQSYVVDFPDLMAEPSVFNDAYFEDFNNYKDIESIVIIRKSKPNNFKHDTLFVNYYNELGMKYKNVNYDDNEPEYVTISKFKGEHVLSWNMTQRGVSDITRYSYNDAMQIIGTTKFRTRKRKMGDTTKMNENKFIYEGSKLMEWTQNLYGPEVIEKYKYSNDRVVGKTGGYISKTMKYDDNGNLIKVLEYMGPIVDETKLMGIKSFKYDKENRVVVDSILTSNNLEKKKYQISHYEYNDEGRLRSMKVTFDYHYRNVEFEYVDNRLKEVHVETNTIVNAYLKFPMGYGLGRSYGSIEDYHQEFIYDKKGNKVSKRIFVNDELFQEIAYHITYRK